MHKTGRKGLFCLEGLYVDFYVYYVNIQEAMFTQEELAAVDEWRSQRAKRIRRNSTSLPVFAAKLVLGAIVIVSIAWFLFFLTGLPGSL